MNDAAGTQPDITELLDLLQKKEEQIDAQSIRIEQLEAMILQLRKQQFGSSSEKLSPDQLALFDEAEASAVVEAEEETTVEGYTRKAKKRASIPADLPREEIIHDLPEEQKICPHDGTPLQQFGEETSEQLDIIPAQIKVLRHVRLKYVCPCCEQYLVTASKPKQPIDKSIAAPGLLAYISVSKYVDALPLYRQVEIFQRIGIEMDRTTLANWMVRCGQLIQPLMNRLLETLHQERVLHMDETIVQVLNEPGKTPQSQSYMWVISSQKGSASPAVLFHYAPGRGGDVPRELLHDFAGALMTDGYEGYHGVCVENDIHRLGCWAHARRKFMEAKDNQVKGKTGMADVALSHIQKLYRIEQEANEHIKVHHLPTDEAASWRYRQRQEQALPIIIKLREWLGKSLGKSPKQHALGKALAYLDNQWPRLACYLDDGQYPIDNNRAENSIRPFVVGRKNWLFSSSQKGATASANLYSLIETAKLNGLEPYAYLKKVFTDLPNAETLEQVDALLPWNVKGGVG
jgi:transposase